MNCTSISNIKFPGWLFNLIFRKITEIIYASCQRSFYIKIKIPHTGDTDAIGGWTKNTPKPNFFEKTEKIIQNAKTQQSLEICQN